MAAVALTLNYEVIEANDDCVALMRLSPEHVRGRRSMISCRPRTI